MEIVLVLAGIACGTLVAAAGLWLWGSQRQAAGLSRAVGAVRWLSGALLLASGLLAWLGNLGLPAITFRSLLMAAMAGPPEIGPPRFPRPHWRDVLPILPPLILASVGLCWAASPGGVISEPAIGPNGLGLAMGLRSVELVLVICGGLGARALGQALRQALRASVASITRDQTGDPIENDPSATPRTTDADGGWPEQPEGSEDKTKVSASGAAAATYALLTLLVSGLVMANAWQHGAVWNVPRDGGGLLGVWLAWGAAWLGPRQPVWLRASLTAVAAIALVVLAAAG